ncbi:MAG: ImmA/IrrE family metallo-endopeptidase [Oscillospiraceae bacterium]|nr:ImmA/IrrE family metallo-endopeptidase [Oscillospiraceae bacterium]
MAKLSVPKYVTPIREKFLSEGINQKTITEAVYKILCENAMLMPPVRPERIAMAQNFSLYTVDFQDKGITGLMTDLSESYGDFGKRFIVLEKSNENVHRKVGTIAHELGHFFMHCNNNEDFNDVHMQPNYDHPEGFKILTTEQQEKDATLFRNELLMPWHHLKPFVDQRMGKTWDEISSDIKRHFEVPKHWAIAHLEWRGFDLTNPRHEGGC